ncbi:MAG: phosphate acyltransferase PlsX [Clostridia bacterium]|nr:phosphate acyltransferase PlsX [Clostridia bacterium]
MKIVVDGYGGDNAPYEIVKGAVQAVNQDKDLEVIITGNEEALKHIIAEFYSGARITIVDAPEVITCEEVPTIAIRRKKNSSLVKALTILKEKDVDGFVSAGSTGAVLAGGIFTLGRLNGVKRPALAPVLPTMKGGNVMLIDCGANIECKVEHLVQFAIMGICYMQAVYAIANPKVGLLSNGAENEKGSDLIRTTNSSLRAMDINFAGNVEARDIVSGDYDVIVADGFNGNIALKSAEGTANMVFAALKEEIGKSFKAKIGALLMKSSFKALKKRLDYTEYGGAAFLGVLKPLIKTHGSTKAKSIAASILQAKKMAESGITAKLDKQLKKYFGNE